ncbi:MAG: iron-containing alcohol dehydrogenase [Pirellulales bacterium]|nr:iron-containing alcohol dehydrogenase [Pirellulales bacterium]
MNYDFLAPRKIVFGWGRRREAGDLARGLGRRAFLISGLPDDVGEKVLPEINDALHQAGLSVVPLSTIRHEPEAADVDREAAALRRFGPGAGDFLAAVGGGAAIDLAKALAALAVNDPDSSVVDYLEGVGRGLQIVHPPLPVLAIPTTAGTGAEATKNAVISSYDPPFKKSLRDDRLLPQVALVDPELTVSVPPAVTAAVGMDAITQLIESYLSKKARPIPRALALQGLRQAVPAIAEAVENPGSRPAREAMAHAALLSGMALANSGLGLAHGVAAALGVHCRAPHGAACALMLPVAMRVNREVRRGDLARLSYALFGPHTPRPVQEEADFCIAEIEKLCDRIRVPRRLRDVGVRREQIPAIVGSSRGSSMSGNPRELSDAELQALLEEIY